MCSPASFVLTKNGLVFWSKANDSHLRIIKENKLCEHGVLGVNIVKIEITPPSDGRDPRDFKNWDFRIDETYVPAWFDAKQAEALCRAELPEWGKHHILKTGHHIIEGERSVVVLPGSDVTLDVRGGVVHIFGRGNQTITVSGGLVQTFNDSAPTITVSGGVVRTYGPSAPTITVSGGEVFNYGRSAPTITVSGGEVWTYGRSAPTITVSVGKVWTCGDSAPTINVSGGEVWTCGRSAPKITLGGGEVWTCDHSTPTVTVSGCEIHTFDQSAPTITEACGQRKGPL